MAQSSFKQYKINSSPLHIRKNPHTQGFSTSTKNEMDHFQASLNLMNSNHQIIFPKKTPSFNLSKSQEVLPKTLKKPENTSMIKATSKMFNHYENSSLKDSKEFNNYGLQTKKSQQIALKLPKIGTPSNEEQKNRLKANSVSTRPTKDKAEKKNEKKEKNDANAYQVQNIDIKKQKRLSDAGNIGFIMPPENMEEFKRSQEKTVVKPHANSYEPKYQYEKSSINNNEVKIITNFAFKSRPGALPGNVTKTNQDSYVVHNNFCQMKDCSFFAVCDGHGVNGHLVSGFVKDSLTKHLEKEYRAKNSDMKRVFYEAFEKTFKDLDSTSIDINFSGTTTVSLLLLQKTLYSANVGDSRAILISCNKHGEWISQPLSRDQKPDEPGEMQRILKYGGRVEAFKDFNGDPIGPARVWLKHENIPGLAMSRSIGDKIAAQVGVLAEPEILEFSLTEEDKIIVLASDGVWEFLSNDQVMNLILPYFHKNQPEAACEKIIKESVNWWKKEDEVIDDITVILIFLKIS